MDSSIAIGTTKVGESAAGSAGWRLAFWTIWSAEQCIKFILAATLAPFGDEAWYWQESRALDLSYSDLPLATAWLIRLGETLFGHGPLAMRAPFLLLGALLPVILAHTGTRLFGARVGWQAGLLALGMPLIAIMGMSALPDVPLTFCSVVAFDACERAARTRSRADWCTLGLALGAAWLCHYRAAMLMLTGLVFLAACKRGRSLWRDSGLWVALAITLCGAIPLLVFNVEHDWVALGFQAVDRNPWSFHGDALIQPVEQAMVCTPLLYAALLCAAVLCLRRARSGAPWDLLAACSTVPIVAYLVLGCFADDTRLRLHWPLPGYLPLLIVLPVLTREWRQSAHRTGVWLTRAALTISIAGVAVAYGYFAMAAIPGGATVLARVKAFPEHWVGWNEVAAATRDHLAQADFADAVLVADNFMLAAELDFAFDGARRVYALDHPLNAKHGRAAQLQLWQRDEAALRALGPHKVLLVAEPTARRERERAAWVGSLCSRLKDLVGLDRLDLYGGRKRFVFFRGGGSGNGGTSTASPETCVDAAFR
jgi:4-amino-4-deoxy-L-arabinose transferase-like glycosyltransferase